MINSIPVRRGVLAGLVLVIAAGVVAVVAPASAELDGPPADLRVWPQVSPTAGQAPVRIYGQGLEDTTEVHFGGRSADFHVVDGSLITAKVPRNLPANNTFVELTVTDAEGTATLSQAVFYTNATLEVTPVSPATVLQAGETAEIELNGYKPSTTVNVAEVNPLIGFLEDGPGFEGTNPYEDRLAAPTTGATGEVKTKVRLEDRDGTDNGLYDEKDTCPQTRDAANFGIASCLVAVNQSGPTGVGGIQKSIALEGDPTPPHPTLTLTQSTGEDGATVVELAGANWSAAPLFGSDTDPQDPGESELVVKICDVNQTEGSCFDPVSDATVTMTRYADDDPDTDGVQGVFSGATLSGTFSFTKSQTSVCEPDCVVYVSQQRARLDTGALESTYLPGSASLNGVLPVISRTWPDAGPTAGGVPIRIYGTGFEGTTSVTFGGVPAEDIAVLDSTLITAIVPPAPEDVSDNTFVDVTVSGTRGTATGGPAARFFYTDASLKVEPDAGLTAGAGLTVAVSGYQPSTATVIRQASPLHGFLENGAAPPPRAPSATVPLASTSTDAEGASRTAVALPPFPAPARGSDTNIACPVTQQAADFGLPNCSVRYGQPGGGFLERPLGLIGSPVSPAPTVTLSSLSAFSPQEIDLTGEHWNAAAAFGSGTTPDDPGETELVVEICTMDSKKCLTPESDATVAATRYEAGDREFSGATLSGSFTVENTGPCTPECLVRVRQQRFDPALGSPVEDQYIEATTILNVPPPGSSKTFFNQDPFAGRPGTRLNLYGEGANGITRVTFDGVPGTNLRVEEDDLVSVEVPEGPEGLVDLVVFGARTGTIELEDGFFIIPKDFTYRLLAERGGAWREVAVYENGRSRPADPPVELRQGEVLRVEVRKYAPNGDIFFVAISPLINHLQPAPGEKLPAIPHQVLPLFDTGGKTDATGNYDGEVDLPDDFKSVTDGQARCPVLLEQANTGLLHCRLALVLTSAEKAPVTAMVEVPLTYEDSPTPRDPTVTVSRRTAGPGEKVSLAGSNWRGQPKSGASTNLGSLAIELCGMGGNAGNCVPAGKGEVPRTRYFYSERTREGRLTGGTLSGATLTVPVGTAPCESCFVRVRQRVLDTDEFLVATAAITIARRSTPPAPPAAGPPVAAPLPVVAPPAFTPTQVVTPPPASPAAAAPPPQASPPPAPPGGAAPAAMPAPTPGAASAPSPGGATQEEEQAEGAGATHHFMVRHAEDAPATSGMAQAAVALAATGAGCVFAVGAGTFARRGRRRNIHYQPRPRPKGAS